MQKFCQKFYQKLKGKSKKILPAGPAWLSFYILGFEPMFCIIFYHFIILFSFLIKLGAKTT